MRTTEMTANGMDEGEAVDDVRKRYSLKEGGGAARDSLRDTKRDSLRESKGDSLRESKKDGLMDSKRDSLRDTKRDSLRESKRDSLRDTKRDSLMESKRDSLRETRRDSLVGEGKRDSLIESKRDSLRDSPKLDSRRDSGRDSPMVEPKRSQRRDSLKNVHRTKSDGSKSAAERKRASGKSLDKNIQKKDEEKKDGEMVETASMAAKRKALVMERRMLCGCTGLVGLAALVWLVAVCTESWFTVNAPTSQGVYVNSTARYFLYSTSGLFRVCRYGRKNSTAPVQEMCRPHEMFPSEDKLKAGVWVDRTIINYTRTVMFFSIVSLIFMVMGFLFSIYTFRNPRYMFKRLAAGIHFLSGATVMVVIEVLINSIGYERANLHVVHPKDAHYTYGYSFYLGWAVFIFNSFSSITFLIYSKKRKGDKAPTEEIALADEPTIIGR